MVHRNRVLRVSFGGQVNNQYIDIPIIQHFNIYSTERAGMRTRMRDPNERRGNDFAQNYRYFVLNYSAFSVEVLTLDIQVIVLYYNNLRLYRIYTYIRAYV